MQARFHARACAAAAGALAIISFPAQAATGLGETALAAAVILVAVGLGAGLAWSLWRQGRAGSALAAGIAAENARQGDALNAVEGCWWAFDPAGGESASADFAGRLGLPESCSGFAALAAAVPKETAGGLHEKVAALKAHGQPFACDIELEGRNLTVRGTAGPEPGRGVVWIHDVTAERQEQARLRREAAAAEREARARQVLLDGVPVPLWRRGGDLALTWCNTAYAAMLETEPAAAIAEMREIASGLDPGQARKLAQRARDSGRIQSEVRYVVVSGDRRAFRISESPLPGGGTLGTAQDITEQTRAEADLANHIEAHAEVLQNLATAIGIFGPDKRLSLFNRAFAKLWRLDDDWLAQQPSFGELLEVLRERRRLPEQADWQSYKRERLALFTTVLEPKEEVMHLPDERTLRLVITPHPFGGLLFVFEDVTDQLVLERARNTLIAVQRATLDNLYEGVVVFGGDGRLKLWNKGFASIWEIADGVLNGQPHISEVVEAGRGLLDSGNDWPRTKERAIAPFTERAAATGRISRRDGREVDYASVPLPDGAMLFTYLDVTDTTRIERALRDRNEALQAADQLKSEFIANVSYELRTPLNTIIGFAEIIANQYFGELNQRQLEYAEGILDSSHHLLLLVNDILDLATIEAGHMLLEVEPFDLHATLVAILGLTRERARRQNLTIDFECPADIGWFEADERRIKQVLFNLMSNAMKFTPPGGVITLGAKRAAGEVMLWVKDTGIGIPEEEQRQVFEKFYKRRTGGRQPGAGLGLSLVRSFIELHGGSVELDSKPDRGTSVICHLPLAPVAERPKPLPLASAGGSL